jgi:alkanesulfonate monooxygenase SsuD/methylene tetrahydromethanopterin reductase-like flavin-dependent oxidoreductase (luciferase family)
MKVGIALNMLSEAGRPDVAVVSDHLALGDLAEPLGFDSLFALEHHFTGYAMSPAPLQLLAYYAGRTKRIMFGTAVIVLPWHDPIRVAEGIALLDILSIGRCLFGFGRGAASVEYAGFRIPMGEARPRFAEAAQLIRKALSEPEFEWQGEFYQIPRTSIRPRPISHPEERFFASSVSPESAEIMAKLGFGILVVMQNEWPKAAESIVNYREIALGVGNNPPPPIILTNVSCAESRDEAHERAMEWLGKKWQSIDNHYHFSDGHLATVKGYETYGKMAKTYARLQSPEERVRATEFYVKIQIVGTPEDCIQQIAELQRVTGTDHVVTEFSFGGIPHDEAEKKPGLAGIAARQRVRDTAHPHDGIAGGDQDRRLRPGLGTEHPSPRPSPRKRLQAGRGRRQRKVPRPARGEREGPAQREGEGQNLKRWR